MLSFFTKKDYWGNGLSVWVLAFLLFLLPFLFSVLQKTEMNNEVEAWLPERDPQAVLLAWYNDNFPVRDRLFLSWNESDLADPRCELFAAKLEGYIDEKGVERRGSPYVADVLTPQESLQQMLKQNIDTNTGIDSLSGLLVGKGALKVRLSENHKTDAASIQKELQAMLQNQHGILAQVLPAHQTWQPTEAFSPFLTIRQKNRLDINEQGESLDIPIEWEGVADHDFQLTWHLIKPDSEQTEAISSSIQQTFQVGDDPVVAETFFGSGSPVSLVITLSEAGEADRSTALEDIQRIATECFIPAEEVHIGGRPVGSAMLNEEVKKAAFNPAAPWYARSVMGFSTLLSFLLAFLMLRSFRLGLLVLTVSLYATLLTVALIPLTGSTLNMVLVVMPTLLSVLTLSGAIHLASYWKHAAQNDNSRAVIDAIQMAAQPCFLASATTAIGLASLMTSTLNPVRDFGIYSAIGCGLSLLFVLFVLPALMQLWPGKPPVEREMDGRVWKNLAHGLIRFSPLVVICCMGMFAYGVYGLRYFKTETKVVRYFPDEAPIIKNYWFLEDNVVGVNTVDTIIRFDKVAQEKMDILERLEVVRQVTEKIRQHPEISGAISLSDFQKTIAKPAPDARFLERIAYNKRNSELSDRMNAGGTGEAASLYTKAVKETDWKQPGDRLLSQEGDELWRISAQAYVMADNDYGLLMDELDAISGTVLANYEGTGHSVTGMVPVFLRTQEALLESLIWSFGMAFGIIAIVMISLLRNPVAGLITMLPNLMPVAFCFGALSMMGIRVDIGTMITASVALGIAIDGTLHLLTWYKDGIKHGKSRHQSIELALSHCAPAMCQTSAIVAIGLLMLAPASLLMISRFGILMAALITAALIADIVFLPALLAGSLGKIIEKTVQQQLARQTQSPRKTSTQSDITASHASNIADGDNGRPELTIFNGVSPPHHKKSKDEVEAHH